MSLVLTAPIVTFFTLTTKKNQRACLIFVL